MMLLPLLFLIGVHDWVPARWGSGDPKTLDLLRGGSVNCLLLEAENWNGGFVESAATRHLAILGVIHPGDAAIDLAKRALRIKLNGIVMEGGFERSLADRVRREAAISRQMMMMVSLASYHLVTIDQHRLASTLHGPTAPHGLLKLGYKRFA